MNPEPTAPHYPTRTSIAQVRSILIHHTHLPAELIYQILDQAQYWSSIRTECALSLPLTTYAASATLLTTPPLETDEDETCWDASDTRAMKMRDRRTPYRQVRIELQTKAVQRKKGEMAFSSGGEPVGWMDWRPGRAALVISILRREEKRLSGQKRREDESDRDGCHTLCGEHEGGEGVPVVEEPLGSEKVVAREIIWSWKDTGRGGDVVRRLRRGDRLSVRTRLDVLGWGVTLFKLQVEVFNPP